MKKLIITIPQFGAPKIEAEGFNGEGCVEASKPFERILSGGATENREFKPEWQNSDSTAEEEERLQW